ncbi:MAG: hypothetical protein AAGJ54_03140 [Planctomycetota bacterium]
MLWKWAIALAGLAVAMPGCQSSSLAPPNVLVSPYDTAQGEALWAVVPLINESGTTILESDAISDAVVRAAQQIEGIRCLPLNRTLAEMRGLGMLSVSSPEEASALAARLGVNGLIVGTISDYNSYEPPTLGLSLVLETGESFVEPGGLSLDGLRGGVSATSAGETGATARFAERPVASMSAVFDGRNHATQMEIRRYARGRHEAGSARGWQTYLSSMPLFTEFAAHAAVSRLLDEERLRLARQRVPQQVSSR